MPKIKLASIIASVAQSLEDARSIMHKQRVAVDLEELECTLTFQVDVDLADIEKNSESSEKRGQGTETEMPKIKGLKFLGVRNAPIAQSPQPPNLTSVPSQPEIGKLTIRVILSPKAE